VRKNIRLFIVLYLLLGTSLCLAYQTIPFKPLQKTNADESTDTKLWLPQGAAQSYSDESNGTLDVTTINPLEKSSPAKTPLGAIVADPTSPLVPAVVEPTEKVATKEAPKGLDKSKFKLNQILISSTRRAAVINDEVVKEGDTIEDAQVVKIEANKVTLKGKNQTIDLTFTDTPIRITSKHTEGAKNDNQKK